MSKPDSLPSYDQPVVQPDRRPEPVYLRFFKSLRDTLFERAMTVPRPAAPTAADIPDGEWRIWKNTTTATLVIAANDGGVIKTVTLT